MPIHILPESSIFLGNISQEGDTTIQTGGGTVTMNASATWGADDAYGFGDATHRASSIYAVDGYMTTLSATDGYYTNTYNSTIQATANPLVFRSSSSGNDFLHLSYGSFNQTTCKYYDAQTNNELDTITYQGSTILYQGPVGNPVSLIPADNNGSNLGGSGNRWSTVYATAISSGATDLTLTGNGSNYFFKSGGINAGADGTQVLGASAARWANVYTIGVNSGASTGTFTTTVASTNNGFVFNHTNGSNDPIIVAQQGGVDQWYVKAYGAVTRMGPDSAKYSLDIGGPNFNHVVSLSNANVIIDTTVITNTEIYPGTDNSVSLGDATHRWSDVYTHNVDAYGFVSYTGATTSVPTITWTPPTLLNSWVNFGAPYDDAGFFKDANGIVHLRGLVKNGSSGSAIIFQLPAGYRPANSKLFSTIVSGATGCEMTIDSGGDLYSPSGSASTTWTSLENISFLAEA